MLLCFLHHFSGKFFSEFLSRLLDVDAVACSQCSGNEVVVSGVEVECLAFRWQLALVDSGDVFTDVVYVPASHGFAVPLVGMGSRTYSDVRYLVPVAAVVA